MGTPCTGLIEGFARGHRGCASVCAAMQPATLLLTPYRPDLFGVMHGPFERSCIRASCVGSSSASHSSASQRHSRVQDTWWGRPHTFSSSSWPGVPGRVSTAPGPYWAPGRRGPLPFGARADPASAGLKPHGAAPRHGICTPLRPWCTHVCVVCARGVSRWSRAFAVRRGCGARFAARACAVCAAHGGVCV